MKKLKDDCDRLVKEIVKIRDNYVCQKCSKRVEGMNAHGSHVIPVSAGNKLRWDEQNIKTMCFHCHIHWWHKNPLEAADWFKEKFPERWAHIQANRGIVKITDFQMIELRDQLKEKLAKISQEDWKAELLKPYKV